MARKREKRFTVREWSWILYDWANSVYATNIMAAIFPIIFANAAGEKADVLLARGISLATLILAVAAPFLGAFADFRGMKKKLFTSFMLLGAVSTLFMTFFIDNWQILRVAYILSRIGFSGSCLFYDSFLTDVTTDERMDKVSSWGYAMGYIGGSTIPFLISIVVLVVLKYSRAAYQFSILITSVWWILFSIPFLKNVHQVHFVERGDRHPARDVVRNTFHTARDIFRHKGLGLFVLAYFFYIDGVSTIINISTAYGSTLGLSSIGMILALLVTQIVAMPCSILFASLSARITARKALIYAIAMYTVICVVGFYMGFSLEPHQAAFEKGFHENVTARLTLPEESAGSVAEEAYVTALRTEKTDVFLKDVENGNIAPGLSAEKRNALSREVQQYQNLLTTVRTALQKDTLEDARASALSDAAYSALGPGTVASVFDLADQYLSSQGTTVSGFRSAISLSTVLFWAMAVLVGTVQGGIQAVSRSFFGRLIPKDRSNEFFGFFDIFGKFAAVLGPFLYSLTVTWSGRSSFGVLALIFLFLVGLFIMIGGKKEFEALESSSS